jgi:AcrR family transcriptional regulator
MIARSPFRDSYHHGDLEKALIQVGSELLSEEGIEGLSLREVARRAGVSHSAVYRHYADKEALLAAIASRGFIDLAEELATKTRPFSGAPRTKLYAGSRVYVQFARQHPHLLRVMFGSLPHAQYPDLQQAARKTFDLLVDMIAEGQEQGSLSQGETLKIALTYWSLLHGLSNILTAEKIPYGLAHGITEEDLVRQVVDLLFTGIGVRA